MVIDVCDRFRHAVGDEKQIREQLLLEVLPELCRGRVATAVPAELFDELGVRPDEEAELDVPRASG